MTEQDKQIAAIEGQLRRDADTIALHHLRTADLSGWS